MKKAAILSVVVLTLITGAAVAAYFLVPGVRGSEPENTARYFPEDTLVYSWATFTPGIGQGRHMLDIWDRFEEMPRFKEIVDDLLEDIEEETGIDVREEVLPWIGPDLSFALMDVTEDTVDIAALIGVKDHDAASSFLRDFLEYLDENMAQLERSEADGFEVWADEETELMIALSEDWFVVATNNAFEDVLDLMSGEAGQSLADNSDFQEARSAMESNRAMSLYMDLEAITNRIPEIADLDLLSEMTGLGEDILSDVTGVNLAPGADAVDLFNTPDWVAVSVGFIDRGVVTEMVAPYGSDFFDGFAFVDEPAKLLPDDILFLGVVSFEPNMDNWRAELEKYTVADLIGPNAMDDAIEEMAGMVSYETESELDSDSTLAEALDYAIDLIDESIGIDLEKDFFDHLGGQVAIGVRDFDFDRAFNAENYAIDAVAMLSYTAGSEEGLTRTVDKFVNLIEEEAGEEFPARAARNIGADHEAVIFDIDDLMGETTAYSPGYVFHSGHMTIGSTERALKAVVDAQNGGRDTLNNVSEYRRARESLTDRLQFLMFLDLRRVIAQLYSNSPDLFDADIFEILQRGFGAVAVGGTIDAGYSRATLTLTLFPE